jgi:acyl-CoA thioesterase FadM
MADPSGAGPASVTVTRRVEWMDTDAAGIYHWTTAFRLAESAEAALHTALGFAERTFGWTPRVAVEATFTRPLRFNDPVDVELTVERIGRTSVAYRFTLTGPAGVASTGTITTCLVDPASGQPTAWPPDLVELLSRAGPQ